MIAFELTESSEVGERLAGEWSDRRTCEPRQIHIIVLGWMRDWNIDGAGGGLETLL